MHELGRHTRSSDYVRHVTGFNSSIDHRCPGNRQPSELSDQKSIHFVTDHPTEMIWPHLEIGYGCILPTKRVGVSPSPRFRMIAKFQSALTRHVDVGQMGDAIEFAPDDTPRSVEKPGIASLPLWGMKMQASSKGSVLPLLETHGGTWFRPGRFVLPDTPLSLALLLLPPTKVSQAVAYTIVSRLVCCPGRCPEARVWWAVTVSNCRPPGCKPGALPAELTALLLFFNNLEFDGQRLGQLFWIS